jgi:hypothetical protein
MVTEVTDDSYRGMSVRTFGPYGSPEQAEQERRSRHLGNLLKASSRPLPRTFVSRAEEMSE